VYKASYTVCPTCKERFIVPPSREHLIHCSRPCYNKSLLLDPNQIKSLARRGISRSAAALILKMPYSTLMNKLKVQGLNNLFPSRGKWDRQVDGINLRGEA
jgi:hypothetical protein